MTYRLGIVTTHPVQYYAPWFRELARRLDIEVFYAYQQDAQGQADAGFGKAFEWDIPLLDGYSWRWLKNISKNPGLQTFGGCDTPEIHDIVKNGNFDAFLAIGWHFKSALQTAWACKKNGIPFLMRGDSQLGTPRSRLKSALKYLPYRLLLPRVDAHLYVGTRNREYLEHYGVPQEQLFYCPHAIDNDFFKKQAEQAIASKKPEKIREELNIPPDAFIYLFVGKFIPKKRVADFIRAFQKAFPAPHPGTIHAILVGDGPLKGDLLQLAKSYLDKIHFVGFKNQSELPTFYATANALVLPSDGEETWGLVVNEAMACGIPAIVSDAAGCSVNMIDDKQTGLSFPLGDIETFSDKLKELVNICHQQKELVAKALVEKMALHSIKQASNGLQKALDDLVSNKQHRMGAGRHTPQTED